MAMTKANAEKRVAMRVALVVLIVIIPFAVLSFAAVLTPPQFDSTYYGELPEMYEKLAGTEGRKIVVIGNSSVAFGVDSALCERLLREGGEDYTVCNFGLYGTLGTKMMLELANGCLQDGDIVVFAPELTQQTLSTYFSAEEAWYALDGDMSLFWKFSAAERGSLMGNFPGYISKKYDHYRSGHSAEPSEAYARDSFDDNCDLRYTRPYNIMQDGFDRNEPVTLAPSLFSEDFISYVNSYYADVVGKGVRMFYSFPPVNAAALTDTDEAATDAFYSFVRDSFDFPVMTDISSRIMDKAYFYDTNFHLNEAGMTVNTVNLVEDIKNQLGNTSKTEIVLPEKPIIPDESIEGEGDNSCADCFTYIKDGNYYIIDGLTEKGAEQVSLVVPYQVNGLYVKAFTASVFAGYTGIAEITIQQNIKSIPNNSFNGCRKLKKIIITHEKPSQLSVGYGLLDGTNAEIYIPEAYCGAFINDYSWGTYEQKIVAY